MVFREGALKSVTLEALGRTWEWPAADVKCRKAVFHETQAIDVAMCHVRGTRTVVQAGGNMGLFPHLLARKFARVVTAEPDPRCFACLDENVKDTNVEKHNVAFADRSGVVRMEDVSPDNLGAQRIQFGGSIPCVTIDSLHVDDCDLIYLDVEGAEMLALRGATQTIALSAPLIAVEDKGLSAEYGTRKGDIGAWLAADFGYRQVATFKRDVFFACG